MTTRAVEQVDQWDSRPFSGGYRGLHDLSDDGFSGIVTAGPSRLCMTKGNVVGVLDGGIEDFESASGTAHEAPSPALPLLAVMQERSDEVRAQYYTEDTPLEKVDRTLADGNFTGYVELAENVLSGDYYQVYHRGRSMSVAFVGASEQLLVGDEAFEKAGGEVGIYEVRPVEIETIEIPEPEESAEATASATVDPEQAGTETAESTESADPDGESGEAAAEPERATDAAARGAAASDSPESDPEPASDRAERTEAADETGARDERSGPQRDQGRAAEASADTRARGGAATETGGGAEPRPDDGASGSRGRRESARQRNRPEGSQRSETRETRERRSKGAGGRSERSDAAAAADAGSADRQSAPQESVGDLETRSVPSLDPDRTSTPEDGQAKTESAGESGQSGRERPTESAAGAGGRSDTRRGRPQEGGQAGREPAADPAEIERLQAELDDREGEIERLEGELEAVESERADLEERLREVREERDELREQVERLERRIDELSGAGDESVADRQRLGPREAIDDTNLFVRYRSKGDATLEAAYEGRADAEAVNENLEIQHHTQFEADEVAVDGEPFASFLAATVQYRFVEWVVRVLPYEIRDTGHEGALKDLYDALPKIDRAELNGTVSVTYLEDGEEHRSQETFDVVLRDRMGNPLAVANINQSRQPASKDMMESLITAAQRVGEAKESLAGGFLVTSSFFEPEAMEAAADATGGGLLSRDSRESFVKLSRKDGFHLCLVEAREEKFNLSVPEI